MPVACDIIITGRALIVRVFLPIKAALTAEVQPGGVSIGEHRNDNTCASNEHLRVSSVFVVAFPDLVESEDLAKWIKAVGAVPVILWRLSVEV